MRTMTPATWGKYKKNMHTIPRCTNPPCNKPILINMKYERTNNHSAHKTAYLCEQCTKKPLIVYQPKRNPHHIWNKYKNQQNGDKEPWIKI